MTKSAMKVVNKQGVLGMFDYVLRVNEGAVEKGIKMGGLLVQNTSMRQTPVDTGALRASHRTRVTGKGFKTQAKVEVMQSYAIYVHEDPDAKHAEGTNYKFLANALTSESPVIKELIKNGSASTNGGE